MNKSQHPFAVKFRHIVVPFLTISLFIVGCYTLLNWLLFIKHHIFPVKEDILNFWIPFFLPWLPLYLWLQPRIKLLQLKDKKSNTPYILIPALTIAITTIIAQSYLQTASGTLTQLENINQIDSRPVSKYYTLQHFYIDKAHVGLHSSFNVTGRNSEHLDMNIYAVFPILERSGDTSRNHYLAWYGVKYNKQIGNGLDQKSKEDRYDQFFEESQLDLANRNLYDFVYFDRIGYTDDHQGYLAAIKSSAVFAGNTSTTILVPVDEPFEQRNGNTLVWLFGAFTIGSTIWLIMLAIPKVNETALQSLGSHASSSKTSSPTPSFFIPQKDFFITPIIIDLNILVFLLMFFAGLGVISFQSSDLLHWGANYKPYTTNDQWWRLVTSMFVHDGIMHLFGNIYGLILAGFILEPRINRTKYIIIYFVSGIIASLTSLWWHTATISIGASGAIFGLFGAILSLTFNKTFPKTLNKAFLFGALIFVAYNLLTGLAGSATDNAAHIGGLISGFILGWLLSSGLIPSSPE